MLPKRMGCLMGGISTTHTSNVPSIAITYGHGGDAQSAREVLTGASGKQRRDGPWQRRCVDTWCRSTAVFSSGWGSRYLERRLGDVDGVVAYGAPAHCVCVRG